MLFADSAPVDAEPRTGRLPDHAPEAVQPVALVEDQLSVALSPVLTLVGVALSVSVGTGVFTPTVADLLVLPPVPVQSSV